MWMTQASRVVRYYTQSLLICAVLFYGPKPIFAQGRQEPSTPGSVNSEQEAGTEPEDPRAAQTLSTPRMVKILVPVTALGNNSSVSARR